jgi:uncharacterized NAD(P)/FAD-binding protein YdhS
MDAVGAIPALPPARSGPPLPGVLRGAPRPLRVDPVRHRGLAVTPVPVNGPVGSAGWQITTSHGDEGVFDGVLVANGHLWSPKIPTVPGTFDGKTLHSVEYRNLSDIEGDRVLVVGAGNSGCDIAVDLAQHRLEVDVVMRKGIRFQPKTYFGVPR